MGDAYKDVSEVQIPCWCTAAPYRVRAIDRTAPELDLLRRGVVPVQWELYPYWGQQPTSCIVTEDRIVRFPVPSSAGQANAFLEKIGNGYEPTALQVLRHPEDRGLVGPCAACFAWDGVLEPCECGLVAYCNSRHAAAHRELHSLVCTGPR